MNITIAVDIRNSPVSDDGYKNLLQSLREQENVDIVFITDKKRYELPDEINEFNAKMLAETPVVDGVLFTMSGTEILSPLAASYIRSFYQYNSLDTPIPGYLRGWMVSEVPSGYVVPMQSAEGVQILNYTPPYLVSCIIPIFNTEKYLQEAIESVVNQTIGFEENIQLILINDGSTDGSADICRGYLERYLQNVVYIEQRNEGVSTARNTGLDIAGGEYIFFLDADDYIDIDLFERGIKLLNEYGEQVDFVSFPIYFIGNRIGRIHPLEYRFVKTGVADLMGAESNFIEQRVASCFFRTNAINNLRFDKNMKYAEDAYFITQILRKKMKYALSSESNYYYRKAIEGTSALDNSGNSIHWYNKIFVYHGRLIDEELILYGYVTRYTQSLVMYDIQWYKLYNISDGIRERVDIDAMHTELKRIINYIDDDIIIDLKYISFWQKIFLLELKHGIGKLLHKDDFPGFYFGGIKREGVTPTIWIANVEESMGLLTISGSYNVVGSHHIELVAVYNDMVFPCIYHDVSYRSVYFLGKVCYRASVFDIKIPLSDEGNISFYTRVQGYGMFPVKLSFQYYSRMRGKNGAFVLGDYYLTFRGERNVFKVIPLSYDALSCGIKGYIENNFAVMEFVNDVTLIHQYIKLYPTMSKRRIWLFMDRPNKADDNAEHLFRYCANLANGIDMYFVLERESPDVERIQKIGRVVFFGTDEHKLLHLFSEKFISSAFDFPYIFPFGSDQSIELFQGLVKTKFVFLQHGILLSDMSQILCRWVRNVKLFITSTEGEYASVLDKDYGYNSKVVKLTGLPRYDGLREDTKKQILFMFTWRKDLAIYGADGDRKGIYNDKFKLSEYYKSIISLLNNQNLLDAAEKFGYELVFRPHPNVYVQIADFSFDERVSVVPIEVPYQKQYAEAALTVTDYSSAVFDFAYLKKPIIYFQFNENNWGAGYFDYENIGFGPVVSNHDEVVDLIIKNMQSGCIMPAKYKKRVDAFFAFSDRNNCARVYDAITRMEDED